MSHLEAEDPGYWDKLSFCIGYGMMESLSVRWPGMKVEASMEVWQNLRTGLVSGLDSLVAGVAMRMLTRL